MRTCSLLKPALRLARLRSPAEADTIRTKWERVMIWALLMLLLILAVADTCVRVVRVAPLLLNPVAFLGIYRDSFFFP